MSDAVGGLLGDRRSGESLDQKFYLDEGVFEEDLRQVFYKSWLFAGHTCEIPHTGDYFTFEVGDESVLILRDKQDGVRAFFNVCRHRGSRIALQPCGHAKALVCPYHQWVYALDGQLTNARLMGDDFDKDKYQLRAAEIREVAGLIFVCLAPDDSTPDFEDFYKAMEPQLKPHGLEKAKVVVKHHYEVRANWKTLIENNRECYHCRVSHPEFCMSNYDLGLPGDTRSDDGYDSLLESEYARWRRLGLSPKEISFPEGHPYRVSRLPLKEGFITESLDGSRVGPLMGDLTDPDVGSLRLITLPNFWGHANCDYAMTTRLTPVNAGLTRVQVSFLVEAYAVEGVDYDPEKVAYVWKETSEQDWELCENNYAGIKSLAYEPGPFSEITEASVESFLQWYLGRLEAGMEQPYPLSATG